MTFRRFLSVDYGEKRIGLAVGDDRERIAMPVTVLNARRRIEDQIRALLAVAGEYEIDAFVVGLPVNMDDTEGSQAKRTREFGSALERAGGKPVHFFDERLSSQTADELIGPADLTRKKRKAIQDAVAATVILQGFLDSL